MKNLVVLACGLIGLINTAFAQSQPYSRDAAPSAAANLPDPIYTSRQAFRIPYQYDPQEIARLGAQEVRLYVSQDHGQRWQAVQTVNPQAGRFDFQASTDGEYWFAVQTVARDGQLHPGGATFLPGLIVVVDTKKPTLQIDLKQSEPGRIALQWSISDVNIDSTSITLEFTQTGMTTWEQIPVKPTASGQTSWSIPAGGLVAVRGSARDSAGNEAQSQYQVDISPVGSPTPGNPSLIGPGIPDFNSPIASEQNLHSVPGGTPAPGQLALNPMFGSLPGNTGNGTSTGTALPGSSVYTGNPLAGSPFGSPNPGVLPGPGSGTLGSGIPESTGFPHNSQPWHDRNVSSIPGTANTAQIPAYEQPQTAGYRTVKS
ncbi:MAG: hypothetical protein O3B86_06395, partial [Planctomycetota bacterium]|nr:hypothetical protein [Planctomycetota bacterium]